MEKLLQAISRRDVYGNVMRGAIDGAFAAAVGTTIAVFLLELPNIDLRVPWTEPIHSSLGASVFFSICSALFAGVFGFFVGTFIALIDILLFGRLHAPTFPSWLWLVIGAALGAAACISLFNGILGLGHDWSSTSRIAVIGGFCGLIAGPIFGWLYRERTRPNHLMAQGESTRE